MLLYGNTASMKFLFKLFEDPGFNSIDVHIFFFENMARKQFQGVTTLLRLF